MYFILIFTLVIIGTAFSTNHGSQEKRCYFLSLGCWKDTRDRAIPPLEGKDPRLTGSYHRRDDATEVCYQVAATKGYPAFAVQDQGECFGGPNALDTYRKYGKGDGCSKGKGNGWLNDVYQIICDDITGIKKDYLTLINDGSKKYSHAVHQWLPILLKADAIRQTEIGTAYEVTHPGENKYPWMPLHGKGIMMTKVLKQSVTINGTVTKKIGQRSYDNAKRRTTGLYVTPGEVITITIPPKLVGKLMILIGQNYWDILHIFKFKLEESTQKIASPWGGLISIYLEDIDATTEQGQFEVQIENAIQAPYFVLGTNTNTEWNNFIKKQAAPWAVLVIPGQLQIYDLTERVKMVTDIEKVLKGWKQTYDIGDRLLGIPLNLQSGEEQVHFIPDTMGGWREGICQGGGSSFCGIDPKWKSDPNYTFSDNEPCIFHEIGHGYCYSDLPSASSQIWAELVREYIERTKGNIPMSRRAGSDPFYVLYRMVSFSKFSKGKACGQAHFTTNSYKSGSYENCWRYLYRLPLWEFGWDTFRKVVSSDATATKTYNSRLDRLADLYCKATGRNLIPLFRFYNFKISESVAAPCSKQPPPDMITKYINIANCIINEDIMKCTQLHGFPDHKGICTFSGECNMNPDHKKRTILNNEFDLWGSPDIRNKPGYKNTAQVEDNCLGRAMEMVQWCGNTEKQPITATFTKSNGAKKSATAKGHKGNCYHDKPHFLPKFMTESPKMSPEMCKKACSDSTYNYYGVENGKECWCGENPPPATNKRSMSDCNVVCPGDKSKFCGGAWRINIFKL